MRVLVIGGGIGGMATSIALEQAGLDPYVLEQAPELTEIGSGIGMHANAMRVLTQLGAAEHVRRSGVRIDTGEWRRMDDGRTIFTQHYTGMAEHYGDVYICMHRADLLESLVKQVPSERVRLNAKLVGLEERPDGVVAKLEDGDEVVGDVMVGADGLRSAVRTILFGEQEARFTGVAAWRGTIPMDRMPAGFEHGIVTWPGRGRHAMTYPIRPDLQTFNGFVPTTEILREAVGPVGRPRRPAQLLRGRDGRRAGHHRPHHLGAHHADLLPRPAAGVGDRPDHPHGRRRAPHAPQRGPGRRAGARGLRDARRVPASGGRPSRRAGGAGRVRRAPPGEDRVDAHLRADEPRDVQRARPDPAARTRRATHRDAADGPGRRVDVRLALRPRRHRRRRAAAADGERHPAGDATGRGPAGV